MEREEIFEVAERETPSAIPVIISFLVGGAIGSLVTFYVTRKKMRAEKEAEIADVTEYYSGLPKTNDDDVISLSFDPIEEDHPRDDLPPEEKPYVITQKEYVEEMDFSKETVVYYEKDKILTDMFDAEISIKDTIGEEVLNHFGEDEEDIAYARNDKLGIDYEVMLEHKSFASVMGEDIGG